MYHFLKETNVRETSILETFKQCSDTVKEYINLNLFKDGLLTNVSTKTEIDDFISKLKYPLFKLEALRINQTQTRGIEKSGYINNDIKKIEIFDTNNRKTTIGDLFKLTTQPYIIFDFCGSWCKPCIEEISDYAKTKHLDNSKKIKPIWLFFENDKKDWMGVVKKYGLKEDNCYVITGNDAQALSKQFAILFDWQGEFPHHFLFSNEGKLIQNNATSLAKLEEQNLPVLNNRNNISPSLPISR